MSNHTNNCLYNVYTRDGLRRMTGWEAQREFGRGIWDDYTEGIDHSEWCPCLKVNLGLKDPFLNEYGDTEPPF